MDDNSYPKEQKPKHGYMVEIKNPDFISTNSIAPNQQLIPGDALINKIELEVKFDCAASESIIPY
jgi:hypothetical protein